jgi:hypothetical protein
MRPCVLVFYSCTIVCGAPWCSHFARFSTNMDPSLFLQPLRRSRTSTRDATTAPVPPPCVGACHLHTLTRFLPPTTDPCASPAVRSRRSRMRLPWMPWSLWSWRGW